MYIICIRHLGSTIYIVYLYSVLFQILGKKKVPNFNFTFKKKDKKEKIYKL